MADYRFGKKEKLKSRKSIAQLFETGESIKEFPIRLVYHSSESDVPEVKVAFSVSKKRFKKAVDRNRIKRLMREAYRLNKTDLVSQTKSGGLSLDMMFIYLDNELTDFHSVEKAVIKALVKMNKRFLSKNEE